MRKIIKTHNAPLAIGTYSQGVTFQNMVFTSGQICINPQSGKLINKSFPLFTKYIGKIALALLTNQFVLKLKSFASVLLDIKYVEY